MSAFVAATRSILADPNIGEEMEYRAGGVGAPVEVRAARSSPDRVAGAFDSTVIQATDVVMLATADVPAIAPGDTLTVGSVVLTVTHVVNSAAGAYVTAYCVR